MEARRVIPSHNAEWQDDAIRSRYERLLLERLDAELNLVGAVLADHQRMLAVAARVGIRQRHFSHEDLMLVYLATVVGHHHENITLILKVARAGLQQAGYWDPDQTPSNIGSALWSDRSLAALACSWHPSSVAVRYFAKLLIDIDLRQQRIEQAHHALLSLFAPIPEPSFRAEPPFTFEGRAAA